MISYIACQKDESFETNQISLKQNQLNLEKQNLELKKKYLEDLKNQIVDQTQRLTKDIPVQISKSKRQIQELTDILQNLRLAEQDLLEAQTTIFRERTLATQIAREQIEQNITMLLSNLQQTELQLNLWIQFILPLSFEQNLFYQKMNESYLIQKQQLEELYKQKINITENELQQTRIINQISYLQKIEFADSQIIVQEEIFFLREVIEKLQLNENSYRSSLVNLNQLISQAQKQYETQAEKVKTLENKEIFK